MKELKTFFKSHEAGRTIPKLSLLKTNVLQNNFKTADPDEFARLQYASKEDLQEAMDLALENHQLQMIPSQHGNLAQRGERGRAQSVLNKSPFPPLAFLRPCNGLSQTVDSNFLDEFIKTHNLGKLSAGKHKIHIEEVDRRMTVQLEAAEKAFETVEDLCY
eukprot:1058124-Rhodomonas_salina.1